MPLQQFDERLIYVVTATLTDTAVPGTYTRMLFAAAQDVRYDVLMLYNSDTVDHLVHANGQGNTSRNFDEWVVTVPAGAGYGSAPVDVLAIAMASGYHYWLVSSGFEAFWTVGETIGAGQIVHLALFGGGF